VLAAIAVTTPLCASAFVAICRRSSASAAAFVNPARLPVALPASERALWATALYGGLRSGELRALRVGEVDLDAGVIHVRAGWDDVEGEIAPKSLSGERVVPIIADLRPILLGHLMATGRRGKPRALVFGRTDEHPFPRSTPRARARKAWEDAGLEPITMHEARHSYASTMVAAGVDPGEVMRRMGHSTIAMTLDRYTHALRCSEADTAAKIQAFIARGTVRGTVAPENCEADVPLLDTRHGGTPASASPASPASRL